MTQPLSPAAQAIDEIIGDLYDKPVRCVVAAALRAVARQPYEVRADIRGDDYSHYCAGVEAERNRNLAIATELEGQALPQPSTQPTTDPC